MIKKIFGSSARLAVLAAFFTNGAVMATWVSRIPAVQGRLDLSEGALGMVLLGMSVGVLVALFVSGGLITRFGSRIMTLTGALVLCATLPLLALMHNAVMLWIALFLFGAMMSMMDVSMNEQAVLVERKAGKPLMSSFHGAYSVGGLTGALIGSGMASLPGMPTLLHFIIVAVFFAIVMIASNRYMLPSEPSEAKEKQPVFSLPQRALWALGVVAFCSATSEGVISNWSAVYLTNVLDTTASLAALGFAAFSMTMTVGRMVGDALRKQFAPAAIVRLGGLLAGLGLLAVVLAQTPVIAMAGFGLAGLGLANVVPMAYSAAGNTPGIPSGVAIASMATIGYTGFLTGPPMVGLVAEQTSLRTALALIMVLASSLVLSSRVLTKHDKRIASEGAAD